MAIKNMVRIGVSVVISMVFLWLAVRQVDLQIVLQLLKQVKFIYVGAYALSLVFVQVCRAVRWHILVRPFAPLTRAQTWQISNLGNMLIMLLPLRLGELARPYLMKKTMAAPFGSSMGAVAVERVLDGLLVTLLFFATTYMLPASYQVSAALKLGAYVALAIFSGAFLVIAATLISHGALLALARRLMANIAPKMTDKVIQLIEAFVDGLRSLPSLQAVASVIGWTLAYWAANAMGFYWLMAAFGWQLPVVASFMVVCVLVIGIMIPAGPGFLGTYQGAIIAGLAVFGVDQASALAYSLIAYLLNLAVVVGFGLPYVFGSKDLRWHDMLNSANQADEPISGQTKQTVESPAIRKFSSLG